LDLATIRRATTAHCHRALIAQPSVLLMDEPMGALDKTLRDDLQVEIKSLQRRIGATVLYITHDQREAMALADRMAVLNAGRVEQIDAPERLFAAPRTSFVGGAAIFRGAPTADSSGRWWLTTDAGQRLPGAWRGRPPAYPRTAELAIAPGDIRLGDRAGHPVDTDWGFEAGVEAITFGGEASTIHLAVRGGARLVAREFGPPRRREGEQVFVSWAHKAATIFPTGV
jgi:ABC-type Fe3+/spermidine/putrescine transport system ATPase subunit